MRKTGNIYLAVITAMLAIWLLPRLWYIITAEPYSTPFTLYSCVAEDFVSLEDRSGEISYSRTPMVGNTLTAYCRFLLPRAEQSQQNP